MILWKHWLCETITKPFSPNRVVVAWIGMGCATMGVILCLHCQPFCSHRIKRQCALRFFSSPQKAVQSHKNKGSTAFFGSRHEPCGAYSGKKSGMHRCAHRESRVCLPYLVWPRTITYWHHVQSRVLILWTFCVLACVPGTDSCADLLKFYL